MDEVLWRRYALGWRAFELVAGWGIILAAVIGFAPAWSGPWSGGAIESWLGGIALCAVPVWLYRLNRCLDRAGHPIHAALVGLVGLTMMNVTTVLLTSHAEGRTTLSLADVLDRLPGSSFIVIGYAAILLLELAIHVSRKHGGHLARLSGPEQRGRNSGAEPKAKTSWNRSWCPCASAAIAVRSTSDREDRRRRRYRRS